METVWDVVWGHKPVTGPKTWQRDALPFPTVSFDAVMETVQGSVWWKYWLITGFRKWSVKTLLLRQLMLSLSKMGHGIVVLITENWALFPTKIATHSFRTPQSSAVFHIRPVRFLSGCFLSFCNAPSSCSSSEFRVAWMFKQYNSIQYNHTTLSGHSETSHRYLGCKQYGVLYCTVQYEAVFSKCLSIEQYVYQTA